MSGERARPAPKGGRFMPDVRQPVSGPVKVQVRDPDTYRTLARAT